MSGSGSGRVRGARGSPTIRAGIVSPASVRCRLDVHPRRSFHCQSRLPCAGIGQRARWSCWWLSNYPCWEGISRRCLRDYRGNHQNNRVHPRRSFHCRSRLPCERIGPAGALVMLVAVQLFVPGLYLPPVLKFTLVPAVSAPDDHFTADPDCRVTASGSGRVGCAGGYPTIRAGIVSAAGAVMVVVRPKRSFHCRSKLPCEKIALRAHSWCSWQSNYPCWDCISRLPSPNPPQTIISLPVQTAV